MSDRPGVTLEKPPVSTPFQKDGVARVGERPQLAQGQDTARSLPGLELDPALKFDKPPTPGSTVHGTLQVGNETRDLYLHVPSDYNPKDKHPMILCLNGMGEGAKGMEHFTGLSDAGDKNGGYIVAYLDGKGTQHAWNNGQRFGGDAHDTEFAKATIDHLQKDLNIDPKRVFMTGYSQGGSGVDSMISKMDGKVAAVADVEGWMSGGEKPLTSPVSALVIKGKNNEFSPYNGSDWQTLKGIGRALTGDVGNGLTQTMVGMIGPHMEPAQHTADYYAQADHAQPTQTVKDGSMEITRYVNGSNGTEVKLIAGEGRKNGWGGSSWPDAPMRDAAGRPVNDTDLIIDFFNHHPQK